MKANFFTRGRAAHSELFWPRVFSPLPMINTDRAPGWSLYNMIIVLKGTEGIPLTMPPPLLLIVSPSTHTFAQTNNNSIVIPGPWCWGTSRFCPPWFWCYLCYCWLTITVTLSCFYCYIAVKGNYSLGGCFIFEVNAIKIKFVLSDGHLGCFISPFCSFISRMKYHR